MTTRPSKARRPAPPAKAQGVIFSRAVTMGRVGYEAASRGTAPNDPKRTTMLKLDGIRRSLSIRRAGHSSVGAPK
jgi:hypothetical protein